MCVCIYIYIYVVIHLSSGQERAIRSELEVSINLKCIPTLMGSWLELEFDGFSQPSNGWFFWICHDFYGKFPKNGGATKKMIQQIKGDQWEKQYCESLTFFFWNLRMSCPWRSMWVFTPRMMYSTSNQKRWSFFLGWFYPQVGIGTIPPDVLTGCYSLVWWW